LLRVITRLNIGGPARQALLLTRALRDSYDTRLVTGRPHASEGELHDPAVVPSYTSLVRPPSPVNDLRALAYLRRQVADRRPVLVHTHMAKAGTLGRLASFGRRQRPRLVHTFHGHVLEGYFQRALERGIVDVERRLARRTDALVAVSPEVRDSLLELGIGTPDRFHVIPLGFDLSAHRTVDGRSGALRERLGLADQPLVGIIGRLAPIKDHATLLQAMTRVPGAHLAVIGDGELRPALEAMVQDLGLSSRVHFTGWWRDIPSAMADLDLVALSSRNEGTPVALIEAAACGRPVIATDVGGVRSVVANGETGQLVPPRDPVALAQGITDLLADEQRAALFGAEARRRSGRFDHARLVDDLRRLYESLTGP
jgi:glycosyltransferase involved in cell wall biosynthesis